MQRACKDGNSEIGTVVYDEESDQAMHVASMEVVGASVGRSMWACVRQVTVTVH